MMHLAVFTSSIANGTALLQVTQLADPIIAPVNKGFLIPSEVSKLGGVVLVGTSLTRGQLTSGSIRKLFPWDFEEVNVGTVIESPPRFHNFMDMPVDLDVNEELDAYVVHSNAAAQQEYVGIILVDGPIRRATGRIQTIHATGTTTLTANAFTAVSMTLDNGLDGGTYAIVGMRVLSATGLFFRLVPRGGTSAKRPGATCVQARDGLTLPGQRYGGWGEWLRFANTAVPQVEVLASAADTSEDFYLDLIKVG